MGGWISEYPRGFRAQTFPLILFFRDVLYAERRAQNTVKV